MIKLTPISKEEEIENFEAMNWLRKKGVTDSEIRYFKWYYFDYDRKKVRFPRRDEETFKKEGYKTIFYSNSPLEKIANRNREGQQGKSFYVFLKNKQNPNRIIPYPSEFYYEDEISAACGKINEKNAKKIKFLVWTFSAERV